MNSLLNLMPDLHRQVLELFALVLAEVELLGPQSLSLLRQSGDRDQVVVRRQVPEERRWDADQWPIRESGLPLLNHLERLLVDDDLVEAGLDQAAGEMLELLAGLDEEIVSLRDLDGNSPARVPGPDMETRISRAPVDGQEVEVGMEACKNGILPAVIGKIRGSWC
jgi:hypothetical protein